MKEINPLKISSLNIIEDFNRVILVLEVPQEINATSLSNNIGTKIKIRFEKFAQPSIHHVYLYMLDHDEWFYVPFEHLGNAFIIKVLESNAITHITTGYSSKNELQCMKEIAIFY
jgi:hypothetical protein